MNEITKIAYEIVLEKLAASWMDSSRLVGRRKSRRLDATFGRELKLQAHKQKVHENVKNWPEELGHQMVKLRRSRDRKEMDTQKLRARAAGIKAALRGHSGTISGNKGMTKKAAKKNSRRYHELKHNHENFTARLGGLAGALGTRFTAGSDFVEAGTLHGQRAGAKASKLSNPVMQAVDSLRRAARLRKLKKLRASR